MVLRIWRDDAEMRIMAAVTLSILPGIFTAVWQLFQLISPLPQMLDLNRPSSVLASSISGGERGIRSLLVLAVCALSGAFTAAFALGR